MPTNLTDTSTFSDPVRAPADGDAANSASFQLGLQDLANRTRFLEDAKADLAGPQTHTGVHTFSGTITAPQYNVTPTFLNRQVSYLNAVPLSGWSIGVTGASSSAPGSALLMDITPYLPDGSLLNDVGVYFDPGTAAAIETNRMYFELYRYDNTGGATQIGARVYANNATSTHLKTLASLSDIVDRIYTYRIHVFSGVDAASAADAVRAFHVNPQVSVIEL